MEERWQEFIAWADENVTAQEFEKNPALGLQRLRSLGETGQLQLFLARFEAFEKRFHHVPSYRNIARASVLTHFGKTELLGSLFDGPLRTIAANARTLSFQGPDGGIRKGSRSRRHAARGRAIREARERNCPRKPVRRACCRSGARPVVTYGIIAANVIAFAAETLCGGSTNPDRRN